MKKQNKKFKIGLIIMTICMLLTNLTKVNAMGNEILLHAYYSGILVYFHEETNTGRFAVLVDNKENYVYQKQDEGDPKENVTLVNKKPITDTKLRKVIQNGYPAVSMEELGFDYIPDAFIATQEAIYMVCNNRDADKYVTPTIPGQQQIQAAKQIAEKALNQINTNTNKEIKITQDKKQWSIQGEYIVKEYTINTSGKAYNTSISIEGGEGIKITDKDNQIKTTFVENDTIKVHIPKQNDRQKFKIILHATIEEYEPYLCQDKEGKEYIYIEKGTYPIQTAQEIDRTNCTITIINTDKDTKQPIQGNRFELLDKQGNSIKTNLITDENGKITIPSIAKGEYQIEQKSVVEGYTVVPIISKITLTGKEETLSVNVCNSKLHVEENENTNKEINVIQEDKQIHENNITDVDNIYQNNTVKEILNQTNETNWYNNNEFINTINRKNTINKTNNHIYNNTIEETTVDNQQLTTEEINFNMERQDFINYIDCIRLGKQSPLKLPVTGK